jgi:hypothetical protein
MTQEVCMSFRRTALLLSMVLPPLAARGYRLELLSFPGADCGAVANGVNSRGAIVGYYPSPQTRGISSFKRDANGVFEFPITMKSVNDIRALGINDSGKIAGTYADGTAEHGFLLAGGVHGTVATFSVPQAFTTRVTAINNRGDFAGYFRSSTGWHSFISAGGVTKGFDVPGAKGTFAVGLAWDGSAVGTYDDTPSHTQAISFVRGPKGNFLRFQVPGSAGTYATAISNASGLIVGWYQPLPGGQDGPHGYVYDYVADLTGLGEASSAIRTVPVQIIDYPGASQTFVTGVNASGVIVGYTSVGSCVVSFTGTPQP